MAKKKEDRVLQAPAKRGSLSFAGDPVVKALSAVIALMVVGFLLTVVFALVNGTIDLNRTIGTSADSYVAKADSIIAKGQLADGYQAKVEALLAYGNLPEAEMIAKEAEKKKIDVSRGDQLNFIQAILAMDKKDWQKAQDLYQQVADNTLSAYKKELKRGGVEKNWAKAYGLHANHYRAVIGIASAAIELKQWDVALTQLNDYVKNNPREFGALADRGEVKYQLGDTKGARADFEKAAKILPEDPVVVEGLKKTVKDK